MGIDYGATPDFTNYLRNQIPYSNQDSIGYLHAGIEFFGGVERDISENISVKVDYSYFTRSVNYTYSFFVFDYTITGHQPFIFVNYLFRANQYRLKLGLGAGYHFQMLDNKINLTTTETYRSNGPAIRIEGTLSNRFTDKFWGYLSLSLFRNLYGKLKDENGNVLKPVNSNIEASLNGYGVGARLGFSFILN